MHLICCFLCEGLGEEKLSLVNKYVNNIYHYYFQDGIWIARSFQDCVNICIQEDVVSSLYDWKTDTFDIHTTECIHRYIHTIKAIDILMSFGQPPIDRTLKSHLGWRTCTSCQASRDWVSSNVTNVNQLNNGDICWPPYRLRKLYKVCRRFRAITNVPVLKWSHD